jgi:aspartyl-tRNA synthetase
MERTHHCNELRAADVGKTVTLQGWVNVRRDLGGVIFIDLRDREGLTQLVFNPEINAEAASGAHDLRGEFVLQVTGLVQTRPAGTENKNYATGEIEVQVSKLTVLNKSEALPFPLDDENVNEDIRLTYRYLDLRRPQMAHNLRVRHTASKAVRDYMDTQGFLEIETPILFKSTPEGAREYLVPSRLHHGKFYALPQSPQQFKQLLMVGGIERYFQIAKCFRDEDLRADRQPEFTQIDIEMSFISREDIYSTMEGLIKAVWKRALNVDIPTPFPRMSFHDAIDTYGIDKPDRRFDLKLTDFTETFKTSSFKVFQGVIASGGVVKAFNAKGLACITAGQLEELTNLAKTHGAKGLAFIKVENGEWKSPIVKFFSDAEKAALQNKLSIEEGDLILFGADQWLAACEVLGQIRLKCAEFLKKLGKLTIGSDVWDFFWCVDFPLLTFDKEAGRYVSSHHPFTAPLEEDIPLLDSDPTKVRGQHYDLVLNGTELGGGSIRIHQPDIQAKLFTELLKIPSDIAEARFGYMIQALRFGAPPHGGIAFGFDRMCALLCGTPSIRDVIAFPKNNRGLDLMSQSPTEVEQKQLRELGISLKS